MTKFTWVLFLLFPLLSPVPAGAIDGGLESLRESGKAFASVAQVVSPSVVNIQVQASSPAAAATGAPLPFDEQHPFGDEFFKRFFGERFRGIPRQETPRGELRPERPSIGQGSGFVFAVKDGLLSDKTFILTNNHVVEGAAKINVRLQDGREFEAKITGRDPQSDVAVIEIPTGGIPPT